MDSSRLISSLLNFLKYLLSRAGIPCIKILLKRIGGEWPKQSL